MIPTNARPFDKDNRPLKGEWIVVEDDGDQGTQVIPSVSGSVDTSTTHGIDAVSRSTAPAKPFPIWIMVVALLVLGGLAFALLNRGGGGSVSTPKATNALGNEQGSTGGSEADLPPDPKAPTIKLVEENHKGNNLRYTFEIDLKTEGATLDSKNPIVVGIEGGELIGLKREGNLYTFAISRTGKGYLRLLRLKYAPGPQNPALPRGQSRVDWGAPPPPPVQSTLNREPSKPPAKQPPKKSVGKSTQTGGGVVNKADKVNDTTGSTGGN